MNSFNGFREQIHEAIDHRLYTMEWLESEVASGRIALLENDKAIIGVERRIYPTGVQELHGLFAAGALEGILELIDLACAAGREAGCTMATISSRPGWARVLKERGFALRQQEISKELV